ncbi:MAG: tetratricopeptide repeat protein [Planctomycetes bacterium]|nr:tetratricopeptide repeat protein [Planctomycetota bacterium]
MTDVAETLEVAVRHHQSGDLTGARRQYQQVLKTDPDNADALHSLGLIALQNGQYDKALDLISKAIEQNSQNPQFYNNLGVVFKALRKIEKAIEAYQQALSLNPDFAEAYNNMGSVLYALGRFSDAVENCRQAISLNPDYPEAYNNLAAALQALGQYEAALENCRQAVLIKPDYVEAYNTMASVLQMYGRCDEAIETYRQAIRLAPDYAKVHNNLGMVLLLNARFIEGWKKYEWRLKSSVTAYPFRSQSCRWDGSSFVGKTLLVCCEQGLGDSLQFVRYLPMVKAFGGKVILSAKKALSGLFRQCPGIDDLVETSGNAPDVNFDFHVPLLSLPGIFATTLETIPADVPYLYADPIKVEYWKDKFAEADFKVGIVWAGSPSNDNDRNRSCALRHFTTLAKIEGVKLYSLQKSIAAAQLDELPPNIVIPNFAEQLDDFTDTAAVIENLDLVISADTAVLHLAGAMGKPVWALLPFAPDWRWMLDRDDSPWYPTMRLFRQEKWNDWDGVFAHIAEQLKILTEKRIAEISLTNQTGVICR